MSDLAFRTDEALNQLQRYGRAVEHERIVAALECLSNVNDDMAHGREPVGICKQIDLAISELNALKDEIK